MKHQETPALKRDEAILRDRAELLLSEINDIRIAGQVIEARLFGDKPQEVELDVVEKERSRYSIERAIEIGIKAVTVIKQDLNSLLDRL